MSRRRLTAPHVAVLVAICTALVSAAPAWGQDNDLSGTGVTVGDSHQVGTVGDCRYPFNEFPFCVTVDHGGQTAANGALRVVEPLPGVIDPLDLMIHDSPYYYEMAKSLIQTRAQFVLVVPQGTIDQVPQAVRDVIPAVADAEAVGVNEIADTAFYTAHSIAGNAAENTYNRCPSEYFCMWQHANYEGGHRWWSHVTTSWIRLSDAGFNDTISSVRNRRHYDSMLTQHLYGDGSSGGRRPCYDEHSRISYVGGAFNDEASGVWNSKSDSRCSGS